MRRVSVVLILGIILSLVFVAGVAAQGPTSYYGWSGYNYAPTAYNYDYNYNYNYAPPTYDYAYNYGYQNGYYTGYGNGYYNGYQDGFYYGYTTTNFPVVYYYYPAYTTYSYSYPAYTGSYYYANSTLENYEGQNIGYSMPYVTECEANGGYAGLGICPQQ